MAKYRNKIVEVDAIQWTGENIQEIKDFTNGKAKIYEYVQYNEHGTNPNLLQVSTIEGGEIAKIGDYIIKGVKGELYLRNQNIFNLMYEAI